MKVIKIKKSLELKNGESKVVYYARFESKENDGIFNIIGTSWNRAREWKTITGAKNWLKNNYPDYKVVISRT